MSYDWDQGNSYGYIQASLSSKIKQVNVQMIINFRTMVEIRG